MSNKLTLEQRVTALEQLCVIEGCNIKWSQKHHVIPIAHSKYDRNDLFNPITNPCLNVCDKHHDMIHRVEKDRQYNHGEAVKRGLHRAKANGVKLGRKDVVDEDKKFEIMKLRQQGKSYRKIAERVGISHTRVAKQCNECECNVR